MSELELIREKISQLTNATFEITEPTKGYPPGGHTTRWFVFCPELSQLDKVAHANAMWEDSEGTIWLESATLGNTLFWIESEYGEEGAIKAMDVDLSKLSETGVRKKFAEMFPHVDSRLRASEAILTKVSSRHGVQLQIRYETGKGQAAFFMTTKTDARNLDLHAKLLKIELSIRALKEAFEEIAKYEAKRAKKLERASKPSMFGGLPDLPKFKREEEDFR